ncbi:CoA transferase [Bradyrhizobium sp. AUGA SZCCT0169]|uniref:CaiB/BaiF CoA transferase family protein n=1 Tax=Bradyrhizobium sp. AUGA SZCCT0169 TaxID=2807663 RepID=UPI001BA622BE|nr:CoA transferase [Bradyrhizobium sp. AUGA SZCCT0169]MBR1250192.1 CoA transferase [Bradyrhizobium sp. AUGA SZCCT0169]
MGALAHLRIVEIGSAAATSYCARLFADFGATVQKIEPPTGDPLRRAAPLTPKGHSAWFAFLNFNKSSVALDSSNVDASSRLTELIAACDILLDGRDINVADCPAFDLAAIKQRNPGFIHLDVSWFGREGPYAEFDATDSTIRALTGLVKLVGPVEGPPMHAPDFQTGIFAGLWGFIAAASSVLGRMQDGRGRSNSLSIFESSIAVTEYIMFESFVRGDIMRRIGVNRFWPTFPVGIYDTKQGWLGVTTVTPAQWRAFCDMLGLPELRDDPALFMGVDRLQHIDLIEGKIIPRLKQRTAQEWFAEGMQRKIPIVPVPDISDLIADEEKKARGAIVPVMIGNETGFTAGSMHRLTGTPPRRGGAVPDIGEQMLGCAHVSEAAKRVPVPAEQGSGRLPLEGIDLGADVIKIEATQYPDWWRGVDRRPAYVLEQMYEKSVRYCIMNRNKRGITLDLTRQQGLNLAKRLLADADVVVDNYSVEVLPKLGLGYEVLSKLNPKLVMMSMSAFGAGSVNRDCRAYGSTLEQGSGLPSVVGDPSGPPVMSHTAFGDAVGGLNGCAAVLTALIHAKLTGKGQFIDLAQIECMMPFAAPWIVAHSIDGKEPVRYGNRHPDFVPHGCFPCAGADSWIVIAVSSDAMWPGLAKLLGRADWATDAWLKRAAGRRAIEREIEAAITAWTSTRDPEAAMNALQAAGIASGVARLPIELLQDPQLHARGFIQEVDRAFIGKHPQPSMPFREGAKPFPIRTAPPTLGEHNQEILGALLGLSDAEIDQLVRDGIIGTEMLMEEQLVKKRAAG